MIELTREQRQELQVGEPIAFDPETRETYVLVRKQVYDRLKNILEDDDARSMEPLLADLDPEDWEDISAYPPGMYAGMAHKSHSMKNV